MKNKKLKQALNNLRSANKEVITECRRAIGNTLYRISKKLRV